jgi:cell division protein FtsN
MSRVKTWGVAIFFSIWSFILGILVGRESLTFQMAKPDVRKEVAELKKEEVKKREAQIQRELTFEHAQTDLVYPDMLRDRKVDVSDMKDKPPLPFGSAEKPVVAEAKDKDKKESPAAKKTETHKTSIVLKPLPKEDAPVPTPDKKLTIQIASYKEAAEADKMIARLKEKGYSAYKASMDINGKMWHRVRVGYFKDRPEAEPVQQKLKKDNFSPIVVNAD